MYSIDKNEGFPVLRTYPVRVSLHAGTRQKYCARVQQKILSNTDAHTSVSRNRAIIFSFSRNHAESRNKKGPFTQSRKPMGGLFIQGKERIINGIFSQ